MKSALIVGIGVLAGAMFCGSASAAVVTWDMGVDLSSAGQTAPMTKSEDGYGDIASGDFAPPVNAGIQPMALPDYDAYARFVDTGSHGNDGFTFQNGVNGTVGTAFTIDMIVWGETPVNSTGRSGSVRVATSTGTASAQMSIEPANTSVTPNIGGNSLWMTFRSGAFVPYGFLFERMNDADDPGWRAVRLSAPGDGTLLVYDFGYGSGTGTLVGTVASMPGGASVSDLGFSLNSISGGTVTASGFSMLGLAMDTTSALGAGDAYMLGVVPEPTSLLLVLFGGLTLIRRRR